MEFDELNKEKHVSEKSWETANIFERYTYRIGNEMLNRGSKQPLELDDTLLLSNRDRSTTVYNKLRIEWNRCNKILMLPKLIISLFMSQFKEFCYVGLYSVFEGAIRVVSPMILYFLLQSLNAADEPEWKVYFWAVLLGVINFIQTINHHVAFFLSMRMGWNWKMGATCLIFDHLFSLNSSQLSSSGIGSGNLVNLISNDVSTFDNLGVFFHFVWESLFELAAIAAMISILLNKYSAMAATAIICILIPIQMYAASLFAAVKGSTAKQTDLRVRHVAEIIDGIASVKSYGWEIPFFKLISSFRKSECRNIKLSNSLRALNLGLFYCSLTVTSFATFTVFRRTGGILTISKVFGTLSLLQTMRMTIGRYWLQGVQYVPQAIASCHRIEKFLAVARNSGKSIELRKNVETCDKPKISTDEALNIVTICKTSFTYSGNNERTAAGVLNNINLNLKLGELLMVIGPVGAGKSSLLCAILDELQPSSEGSGVVIAPGTRIAYCAQVPWIIASSVRANITMATKSNEPNYKYPQSIDEELYALAVDCTRLSADLMTWPAYDRTEIGARGISISGGQKARVALARAIYSDSDLYLLDDPLSAVDTNVGKDLFFDCICNTLKKRKKTVVLVTQQLQYLSYADKILVLNASGNQIFLGNYLELLQDHVVTATMGIHHHDIKSPPGSDGSNHIVTEKEKCTDLSSSNPTIVGSDVIVGEDYLQSSQKVLVPNDPHYVATYSSRYDCSISQKALTSLVSSQSQMISTRLLLSSSAPSQSQLQLQTPSRHEIVQTEDRAIGKISISTYISYLKHGGIGTGLGAILLTILGQICLMMADYWLKWWAVSEFGNQNDAKYIWIFAILTALVIFFGFIRVLVWFDFSLRASSHLHDNCLWSTMHSPLKFFVANPTGRILNRFTKDQSLADESLPQVSFDFLESSIFCFSGLVLVCISIPWMIIIMPFMCIAFLYCRAKYLASSREIKRIEAITRSPIYSDFSATLEGLVTLRAYGLREKISKVFFNELDVNGRAWFSFLIASRWLGFRLDIMVSTIVTLTAILAAILRSRIDTGLLGFALMYMLSLSALFQFTVRQSAEAETQMTSVERLCHYATLPPESGYETTLKDIQSAEPQPSLSKSFDKIQQNTTTSKTEPSNPIIMKGGVVDIKNLCVKYREDLDLILTSLSLHIPAGYKVGICGRTGSGKSSLLLALLRMNIIESGDVLLNGESLLEMSLERARSLVSIIPQEPHLFSGTVRYNLDPFEIHSDSEIWSALADAQMKDVIMNTSKLGLMTSVGEGGNNFSIGQRQLLSLARCILRRTPVILMDEVTASIDYKTDNIIQTTIRTAPALRQATIITIAHRLRTIADSDLIAVIQAGLLVETGTPKELLSLPSKSYFRELVEKSNDSEDILKLSGMK